MNAVASRNIKFLSHTDQGGRGDGVQVMVNRGFAYIGHGFSNGITVIDVRDPKHPKTVNFLRLPAEHARPSSANPWRPAAGGQRPERLDHAGQPGGLFRRHVRRRARRVKNSPAGCASTIWRNRKRRAKSPSCRSAALGRTASGMSAAATPMCRFICRNFPTMCWSSSTWRSRRGRTWSANSGCRACGPAAAKRRPGPRAGATRCITRWSPAILPIAPGATAAWP